MYLRSTMFPSEPFLRTSHEVTYDRSRIRRGLFIISNTGVKKQQPEAEKRISLRADCMSYHHYFSFYIFLSSADDNYFVFTPAICQLETAQISGDTTLKI